LINTIKLIEQIVLAESKLGKTKADHLISLVEEVGELATAIAVESGSKPHKKLDEPSTNEAADVVICALATYYSAGGLVEDLESLIQRKLDKWIKNEKLVLTRFSELAIGDSFRFSECDISWLGVKQTETAYTNPQGLIYGAHPSESVILIKSENKNG
jgi:NTP pyrophosphatase (non-canonical NTP hydrolase)